MLEVVGRPLSVAEIAARMHRHHTWARPHLSALVRSGALVATTDAPSGRGRPATRYSVAFRNPSTATTDHVRLMGVVNDLVQTHGFTDRDVERFGESHGHALTHPGGGLGEVLRRLSDLGFTPRRSADDPGVVPLGDCPLADLVRKPDGALVCTLHRGITRGMARRAGLVGADLHVAPPERGRCALTLECRRGRVIC